MMLSFNLREGDDVWFGYEGQPLAEWQQMIIKDADEFGMTVFTPTEVLSVRFDDRPMDSGVLGVKIAVKQDPAQMGQFTFGMDAPQNVKIMRGRVYRRQLDG
jgi:hypothetical protein